MDRLKQAFGRMLRFFNDVRSELRKVVWPTRQQVLVLTSVVVTTVAFVAVVIWVFDFGLSALIGAIVRGR